MNYYFIKLYVIGYKSVFHTKLYHIDNEILKYKINFFPSFSAWFLRD